MNQICELTLSEVRMVAGGMHNRDECEKQLGIGAIQGMISGALTGTPVGFAISSFTGLIAGAISGDCFRNASNESKAGGNVAGSAGNGGEDGNGSVNVQERPSKLPQQYACGPDMLE